MGSTRATEININTRAKKVDASSTTLYVGSLEVLIAGCTRITATDSTFMSGEAGVWSYASSAVSQLLRTRGPASL